MIRATSRPHRNHWLLSLGIFGWRFGHEWKMTTCVGLTLRDDWRKLYKWVPWLHTLYFSRIPSLVRFTKEPEMKSSQTNKRQQWESLRIHPIDESSPSWSFLSLCLGRDVHRNLYLLWVSSVGLLLRSPGALWYIVKRCRHKTADEMKWLLDQLCQDVHLSWLILALTSLPQCELRQNL